MVKTDFSSGWSGCSVFAERNVPLYFLQQVNAKKYKFFIILQKINENPYIINLSCIMSASSNMSLLFQNVDHRF